MTGPRSLEEDRLKIINKDLKILDDSGILRHLTGSRYFGNHHSKSDWDFFVEYTDYAQQMLWGQGFRDAAAMNYQLDINCVCVLTKSYWDNHGHFGCDVQLVKSFGLRLFVVSKIKHNEELNYWLARNKKPELRKRLFDKLTKAAPNADYILSDDKYNF